MSTIQRLRVRFVWHYFVQTFWLPGLFGDSWCICWIMDGVCQPNGMAVMIMLMMTLIILMMLMQQLLPALFVCLRAANNPFTRQTSREWDAFSFRSALSNNPSIYPLQLSFVSTHPASLIPHSISHLASLLYPTLFNCLSCMPLPCCQSPSSHCLNFRHCLFFTLFHFVVLVCVRLIRLLRWLCLLFLLRIMMLIMIFIQVAATGERLYISFRSSRPILSASKAATSITKYYCTQSIGQ